MDIYIKKQDLESDIFFDAIVSNNTLEKDDTYITASLMSIFTDGSKKQLGTQIDGSTLGNKNYNIKKLSVDNIKDYIDGQYESLQWMIDDSVVSNIEIETEKDGNLLKVRTIFTGNDGSIDNLIYSLDENLDILN